MKQSIKMIVLCRNAEGAPDMYSCIVQAGADEIDTGEHYATAIKMAEMVGYEGPFEAFDEYDPAARQMIDMGKWLSGSREKHPTGHYLLVLEGDVEPSLVGPFNTDDSVLQEARCRRMNDVEMENGLYRLTVHDGIPLVGTFAGMEIDVEEEAVSP